MKGFVKRLCELALISHAVVFGASCSSKVTPPQNKEADLGGGIVARVGQQAVGVYQVTAVAKAQGIAPEDALERLIEDALFAEGALDKRLDEELGTQSRMRAARARWAERQILYAAQVKGPPTAEEIKEARRVNWRAFDCPVAVRVVHAVVTAGQPNDPNFPRLGREQAERLREAVLLADSDADFLKRAAEVASPYSVKPESIPPIADDGYTTEGDMAVMDAIFTKAAFALSKPHETSPVVETPFGFHVLRLVERVPPKRLSDAEIAQAIGLEVIATRAGRLRATLLAGLAKKRTVEVVAGVEALMQTVFASDSSAAPP